MFMWKSFFAIALAHWSYAATITRDVPCEDPSDISYVIGSQNVTWTEAYIICKEYDMELASITSIEEQARIDEVLLASEDRLVGPLTGYWLGGIRRGGCGPDFVWLTTLKSLLFRNFAPGQPDNAGNWEDCMQAFFQTDSQVMWNDIHCQTKLRFICQKRITNCTSA